MVAKTNLYRKASSFLYRIWFEIIARFLYLLSYLKVGLIIILSLAISIGLFCLTYEYHNQITTYLIGLNIDSESNSTGFFSSLFTIIGASLLGVIAITFSLTLLALQQFADKYTPTSLTIFQKDRTNKAIFWIIAGFSLVFFIFAFFPLDYLLIYETLFCFVFLLATFRLLRTQYFHIARLINPIFQVVFYCKQGIRLLNKTDKHLDLMIKTKAVQPKPGTNMNSMRKEDQIDLLKTGLMQHFPNLFDETKKCLDQIYAVIQTYLIRKDYQVTQGGFKALCILAYKYIDVKNGTFPTSAVIQYYDYAHDAFLTNIFEKLTAIQRVASKEKDLVLSKQILGCFSQIAVKCTEIRYRNNPSNEYTHCMLATGYMHQNIEDGLNAGLLDLGIEGSEKLKAIGLVLIKKNSQMNTHMVLDDLSKIAMYGIAKPNATMLVTYPMKACSLFLKAVLFHKDIDYRTLPKTILDEVQKITDFYMRFKDSDSSYSMTEIQYSIGEFVDLSKQTAMPYIFDIAVSKIYDERTVPKEKQRLIKRIIAFSNETGHFYMQLSKCAAEKESFLIHFIDSNLIHITMVLLELYRNEAVTPRQKKELVHNISWLVSNYWRIYDYHKKITSSYEFQIVDHLLQIGHAFKGLSLKENLAEVIGIIVSIAKAFFYKSKDAYGLEPIRIVEKAAYLCILDGSDDTRCKLVTAVKDRFWVEYCAKYQENKDVLFNELLDLDPLDRRLNSGLLSFENQLIAQLTKENIAVFVAKLKSDLGVN